MRCCDRNRVTADGTSSLSYRRRAARDSGAERPSTRSWRMRVSFETRSRIGTLVADIPRNWGPARACRRIGRRALRARRRDAASDPERTVAGSRTRLWPRTAKTRSRSMSRADKNQDAAQVFAAHRPEGRRGRRRPRGRIGRRRLPHDLGAEHQGRRAAPCRAARSPPSRASPSRRRRTWASPCRCRRSRTRTCINRFLSQSNTMDCADISLVYMRYLIGRNVLQAIPVAKVKHWDKTLPLFTKGEFADGRKAPQQGITPTMILYATGARRAEGDAGHADRMGDRRADRHQCRHARHPARPRRPPDHELGRPAEPGIQGPGRAAGQPDDRHHRRGDGARGARRHQVRQQGQHDEGGDRQDRRHHDGDQEGRPLPLVLDHASTSR